jgi:hypothetical protein
VRVVEVAAYIPLAPARTEGASLAPFGQVDSVRLGRLCSAGFLSLFDQTGCFTQNRIIVLAILNLTL